MLAGKVLAATGGSAPPVASTYYIAVAHVGSPRISAYPWSASGFGTKYADPTTLPTGQGNGVAFSPDGAAIALANSSSPYISAYPWSASGFGTKYADPTTLPPDAGKGVAFGTITT
jgi:sugar lactone lactonase YvrE